MYDKQVLSEQDKNKITCGCSSVVEHQPSKLDMWVRFPSPAYARVAQLVERDLAKVEAAGSSPVSRFFYFLKTGHWNKFPMTGFFIYEKAATSTCARLSPRHLRSLCSQFPPNRPAPEKAAKQYTTPTRNVPLRWNVLHLRDIIFPWLFPYPSR